MSSQVRLPGTLPTPGVARQRLRDARVEVSAKRKAHEGLKGRLKQARVEAATLSAEIEQAEADIDAAEPDSAEDVEANGRHHVALGKAEKLDRAIGQIVQSVKLAKVEAKEAERHLAGARDDLQAIRQGRRRP